MRISDWSSDVCSSDLTDGGDADGPAAHGTGIIDQQRDHRVTKFRIALALVGKAMSGVYNYPGKPGRIEQTFFLIEIPGAGLLRHQPPLKTIGELGHCPLHVRELLVQKAAQALQFVLVAEILRRDGFVKI